ncbi:SulA-like leucine-rich domain-containing protein [Alishewanella longhuensis]
MHTCNDSALPELVLKRTTSSIPVSTDRQHLDALQRDSAELQLVKLLQQHRHTQGWIVLIAPAIKPNKAFWAACQLPLNKILVVHQQQIKDITATISRAIENSNCHVVINCAPLSDTELCCLTEVASVQQSRFYTLHKVLSAAH